MSSFAAILVLVACPVNSTHCISEPVRVSTYQRAQDCEKQMPLEIRRLKAPGMRILGSCNTFDARLMADMAPIDVTNHIGKQQPEAEKPDRTAVGFLNTVK
jgi:hypothetical protein